MAEYTKEIPRVEIDVRGYPGIRTDGGYICFAPSVPHFGDPIRYLEEREEIAENMRRMVACWIACSGIPTEILERLTRGELYELFTDHWDAD